MTILIDEKKTTTDSYFYKVPCITSTFTAEILFVDGELHDVVSNFDRVPIRERLELYAALDEKIAELEKGYSEGVSIEQGVLEPVDDNVALLRDKPTDIKLDPLTDEGKIKCIDSINKHIIPEVEKTLLSTGGAQRLVHLVYKFNYTTVSEAEKEELLAFLIVERGMNPPMQSFVDRFREECPNCDIHFFGDSAGGSIWNDKHGCVDWHPEKGETVDQAMKQMKEKIDG